jgi:hypothetical protein
VVSDGETMVMQSTQFRSRVCIEVWILGPMRGKVRMDSADCFPPPDLPPLIRADTVLPYWVILRHTLLIG